MSTNDYAMEFSEVLDVLQHSEIEVIEKIPLEVIKKIKEKSSDKYISKIDNDNNFNISKNAKALLAVIYQDFLCDDEELEYFNKMLLKNEEQLQKSLREKYNPDDIFKEKNSKSSSSNIQNMQMVEYKESFIKQIINKIRNIFKRKEKY